jgi:hypothetical protein
MLHAKLPEQNSVTGRRINESCYLVRKQTKLLKSFKVMKLDRLFFSHTVIIPFNEYINIVNTLDRILREAL